VKSEKASLVENLSILLLTLSNYKIKFRDDTLNIKVYKRDGVSHKVTHI
jgi:hypothetical protein